MTSDVNILHHVGLIASDMDAMITRYEQLGFMFTPLSLPRIILNPGGQPEPLGVGNRCAIFQNNYLEVLGVVDQQRWDAITIAQRGPFDIDPPLRRYQGLHVLHFGADDLDVVRERLLGQGTSVSDIRPFQRTVETLDGARTMHAKTMSFPPGSNPEALIQIAQHITPELVLQPRYMQHRNGAQTLTEIIVCAPDPAALAVKYARYTGHTSAQRDNLHILDLGLSRVVVVAPEQIGDIIPGCVPPTLPILAGFTVATADLDAARTVLADSQISFQEHDGRVIVSAEDACGSAVLFEHSC